VPSRDRRGVWTRGWKAERGQASAELVAVIPALLLAVLVAAQLGLVGWALWSAGSAARAGARAAHVGGDAEAVARSALPTHLRKGVRVSDEDGVEVRVRVPALVPGAPRIPLEARTALDPEASDE
jgi:hypothetical protein